MTEETARLWRTIAYFIPLLPVFVTAIFYIDTRRRDLRWKRTEFLFAQADKLENDPDIQRAIRVLDRRERGVHVVQIFGPNADTVTFAVYREGFEKLLNFLDRIAYAVRHSKSLTMAEVANFAWYYRNICAHACMRSFCETSGFPDVVPLAKELTKHLKDNYPDSMISSIPLCQHASGTCFRESA
jgi:hypothetical protein